MRGLVELLEEIAELWSNDRDALVRSGNKIVEILLEEEKEGDLSEREIDREVMKTAAGSFIRRFDREYGGFGNAPKFPAPHNLMFLLRYAIYENSARAIGMVEKTLEAMYRGGLLTISDMAFPDIQRTTNGLCPTLKKCCMTMLCLPSPIWKHIRLPAGNFTKMLPKRFCSM